MSCRVGDPSRLLLTPHSHAASRAVGQRPVMGGRRNAALRGVKWYSYIAWASHAVPTHGQDQSPPPEPILNRPWITSFPSVVTVIFGRAPVACIWMVPSVTGDLVLQQHRSLQIRRHFLHSTHHPGNR